MTTILVGVDASDRSDDAIALAQDLASTTGSRIVLAAAAPYPTIALPGETAPPQLADEVVRETEHMLAGKAAALEGTGIEVECVTNAFISPPHLLQSLADAEPADLVVVGSTGTGRAGRVLPGSTGERLLHGAPCPVAVAPAGYRDGARRPPRRIGVALDGSDESRAALQAGVVIASRLGGELEVVTVLHLLRFGAPAAMGGPGYDRTPAQMEATALQRLEAVVTGLPPTVRGTTRLLVGDPVEQLAQHSTELDLLLVGSRGYGPLRAVLLGGVSGRLIRRAACPVIVTPRGVDRPLTDAFRSPATAAAGP